MFFGMYGCFGAHANLTFFMKDLPPHSPPWLRGSEDVCIYGWCEQSVIHKDVGSNICPYPLPTTREIILAVSLASARESGPR